VVAAEIIPLLFLAIALEARLLSVQFPNIATLIAEIRDSLKSLDEIETEAKGLPQDSPNRQLNCEPRSPSKRKQQLATLSFCNGLVRACAGTG